MATLKLRVCGLHGHGDESRLESLLRAERGVLGAIVNHLENCAEIEYQDDELSLERLLRLVHEAGYQAELAG
jgi:hypothetical protein